MNKTFQSEILKRTDDFEAIGLGGS